MSNDQNRERLKQVKAAREFVRVNYPQHTYIGLRPGQNPGEFIIEMRLDRDYIPVVIEEGEVIPLMT